MLFLSMLLVLSIILLVLGQLNIELRLQQSHPVEPEH